MHLLLWLLMGTVMSSSGITWWSYGGHDPINLQDCVIGQRDWHVILVVSRLVTVLGWATVFTLRGAAGIVAAAGLGCTLRDGAVVGVTAELVVPWRIIINCWSALLWLSVSGAKGELADGLHSTMVMSVIPAKMRSMDNTVGMGHLVGSQVSMSQICCACVSVIQMV